MKLQGRVWLLGVSLLAVGGCSNAEYSYEVIDPFDLPAQVEAAVDASLGRGFATGYSVAVWKNGAIVYSDGFGKRDEKGSPVTPRTLFQIGSDAKKLTALALMQELEAGNLSLDQTVSELLPDLSLASDPKYFESVTVRDLLRHTTGLYDYAPFSDAPADEDLAGIVYGRFAENEYALMPSGIAHRYSNSNYALLALILEVLAGRPWADLLTEQVLVPVDLNDTYLRLRDVFAADGEAASGYGSTTVWDSFDPLDLEPVKIGWVSPAKQTDNAFTRPTGLVWSTAIDQAKLLGFFIDGDASILSDELRREMIKPQTTLYNHSTDLGYGYAFIAQSFYQSRLGSFHDTPLVMHGGGTLTMSSLSFMLPEKRVAVSVLANGAPEDLSLVARTAIEAAVGEPLLSEIDPPRVYGVPSDDLGQYAGSYTDPNLGDVELTWDGQRLGVASSILKELKVNVSNLQPVGNDLFRVDAGGGPTALSFYEGKEGEPNQYGVSRVFVLTRAR